MRNFYRSRDYFNFGFEILSIYNFEIEMLQYLLFQIKIPYHVKKSLFDFDF